jgi:hypothetical protein
VFFVVFVIVRWWWSESLRVADFAFAVFVSLTICIVVFFFGLDVRFVDIRIVIGSSWIMMIELYYSWCNIVVDRIIDMDMDWFWFAVDINSNS